MTITNRREPFYLLFVDILCFLIALWLMLLLRTLSVPSISVFYNHLVPFSFLFAAWIVVFFIAGLYDKHTTFFRSRLPNTILNAQAINIIIAAVFFFFVPNFGVTPKTSLGIYLIVSSALILFWRLYVFPYLAIKRQQRALLIGAGDELEELKNEVNGNARYPFSFIGMIDPATVLPVELARQVRERVQHEGVQVVVLDTAHKNIAPALPEFSELLFRGVRFIDAGHMYEEVFDREPLSLLEHRWLVENISTAPQAAYDFGKRVIDLGISAMLGALSLFVYPFVALAILLDDGGPIFIFQERVGQGGELIHIAKFRSMRVNGKEQVTRVGMFLRATRMDELPQLWSVILGEQSLIGPRPELPHYVKLYAEQIPYYHVRYLIKPGLSGWAQIQNITPPKFEIQYDATKRKLAYDLYYIKHRSIWLDLKIALKTIKTLLSRSGI